MKIGLDIRSTLKRRTGIGRYTFNLINALAHIDKKNSYYLYSRKKFLDFRRRLFRLPAPNFYHCVDYFRKSPATILPDVDIFHTSSYDLKSPKRAKYIVTIHDVIIKAYPLGYAKETIQNIDEGLKRIVDEADILVADSFNTKTDIIKFYGVPKEKIAVIYPATFIAPYKKGRNIRKDFILFVGTLEPRKNITGLIRAFNWIKNEFRIKYKLVIAGMRGWMFEDIFREFEKSNFKKDIIFKGYVDDEELQRLYSEASVFVYPSFYEGFGFPIIEAFHMGTPVVTSKTSSCGEIAKEAALLINPDNYKEIGEAILKLIEDKNLYNELSVKAFERAREFTWIKTASSFLELFNKL